MYRRKWKNYPHLPKDVESLFFENEKYKQTYAGGKRFLALMILRTFTSRPVLYTQLYIIMDWLMGQVMPAVVLLGGKKRHL